MAIFELDALLEPVSASAAGGPDLEHEPAFIDLVLKAQATPERVVRVFDKSRGEEVEKVLPGKDAEHRAVLAAALALLRQTKDLRVAMHLMVAATRGHGWPGFADATRLIARLCASMWSEMHPRLDPDDAFDPTMRINILAAYNDPTLGLQALRAVGLAQARALGRFTLRDLEVAAGEAGPAEGQQAPTRQLLLAACAAAASGELAAYCAHAAAALADLEAIEALFHERSGSGPDFTPVKRLLRHALALYTEAGAGGAAAVDAPPAPDAAAAAAPGPAGATFATLVTLATLATRADASAALIQVCDFLERAEPAHPAPILVRRAIRLLDMNFLAIMRELTPDAVKDIERLGGLGRE